MVTYLPWPGAQLRHLFFVSPELAIELADLHFDRRHPLIRLCGVQHVDEGARDDVKGDIRATKERRLSVHYSSRVDRLLLTELIASCSEGFGFLLADEPKRRFMLI